MLLGVSAVISALTGILICVGTEAFSTLAWLWILPLSFLGGMLTLALLYFLFLLAICATVHPEVPQEKDSKFYRTVLYLTIDAIRGLLRMKVHTEGLEKTPADGRFLLVCNHIHILDPVTLLMYFKKSQLAFISKRENSSMLIVGKLMHKIMCQMVNRENDREALKTILNCIRLIREDQVSIAVFPEGYTSMDGLLHPFRYGVFKIALKTKVPIVVCTLQNTNKVFHNTLHLKHTDVQLHLLDVIQPEQYAGKTAVQVGQEVYEKMARDLGPELVLRQEQNT